jgi:hypothetical protein
MSNNKHKDVKDVKTEIIKYYHLRVRPRPLEYFENDNVNEGVLKYKANMHPINETHPFTLFYSLYEKKIVDFHNRNEELTFDCDVPEKKYYLNNINKPVYDIIING